MDGLGRFRMLPALDLSGRPLLASAAVLAVPVVAVVTLAALLATSTVRVPVLHHRDRHDRDGDQARAHESDRERERTSTGDAQIVAGARFVAPVTRAATGAPVRGASGADAKRREHENERTPRERVPDVPPPEVEHQTRGTTTDPSDTTTETNGGTPSETEGDNGQDGTQTTTSDTTTTETTTTGGQRR
jgi:hypothetical protein